MSLNVSSVFLVSLKQIDKNFMHVLVQLFCKKKTETFLVKLGVKNSAQLTCCNTYFERDVFLTKVDGVF
jgi:hypothetical protein